MSTTSEIEEAFISKVWEALKGDHNDLRRQQIILRAFREAQQAAAARLSELEVEVARLREALKPFADAADGLSERDYDARVVAWIGDAEPNNGGAYGLHASDFRRARAALEERKP